MLPLVAQHGDIEYAGVELDGDGLESPVPLRHRTALSDSGSGGALDAY